MKCCIYGASSDRTESVYREAAQQLGRLIAEGGHTLVFGGGATGLMGAAARGAAAAGGELIGIAPTFFDQPGVLYTESGQLIFTETMRQRKQKMEELSDAFLMLPGGIGTYDEFFEILTLKQLGRHTKPILVLNCNHYFDPMTEMLREAVRRRFMQAEVLELFEMAASPQELMERLEKASEVNA